MQNVLCELMHAESYGVAPVGGYLGMALLEFRVCWTDVWVWEYHSAIWQLSISRRVMLGADGSALRNGSRTSIFCNPSFNFCATWFSFTFPPASTASCRSPPTNSLHTSKLEQLCLLALLCPVSTPLDSKTAPPATLDFPASPPAAPVPGAPNTQRPTAASRKAAAFRSE